VPVNNLYYYRVAINLKKPGILRDFSEHGKLGEFCATSGKNCNKQSIYSSSFKYLCKTAVDWANRIIRISRSSDPAQ